jgi:hypothetical protein
LVPVAATSTVLGLPIVGLQIFCSFHRPRRNISTPAAAIAASAITIE